MSLETMLGEAGSKVDGWLVDWRIKGVRGNAEEREQFRKEQFHGARAMIRLGVEAKVMTSPELSRSEVLKTTRTSFLDVSAEQADETGFNGAEKEFYIGITRSACDSLAEEYRLHSL